ncbi:MAG: hypothetical protein U1F45_02045 [Burkholderiales bacterium]
MVERIAVDIDEAEIGEGGEAVGGRGGSSATLPSAAPGASLTRVTVIITVASPETSAPSLTLMVKLSAPAKSAFGVYTKLPSALNSTVHRSRGRRQAWR